MLTCMVLCFALISPSVYRPSSAVINPLTLVSSLRMAPDVVGNFDHPAIDPPNHRLFVTPEAYKSVLVVDYRTGKIIHKISGIGVPHAVLYRKDVDRIYLTDGDPGELKIFDGTSYRLLKSIKLSEHTDSIAYDPRSKFLYVISGGKAAKESSSTIYIIDTTSNMVVGGITIDSDALEAMAIDQEHGRLYVNDTAKNRIDVIDIKTKSLVARWPLTLGQKNTSMAIDQAGNRLFVGCRSGRMVIFDTTLGKEITSLPLTTGVDDMVFDPDVKRIYASCGDDGGVIEIYDEVGGNQFTHIAHIPSGPMAKTALLSKALNLYFVAVPHHGDTDAIIQVYKVH